MNMTTIERRQLALTVTALNRCIETCTDGEKGYGAAAADVRDPQLKSIMSSYERQRADFVTELQRTTDGLGATHENQGTIGGTLHRGWTGARMQIEGRRDDVVVDECIRGEANALAAYDNVLEGDPAFGGAVLALIVQQRAAIAAALEDMKNRLAFGAGTGPNPSQRVR